ncbi:MAG: HAD-IIB family hydrolase [Bacilli bacterium]
MKKLPIIFTDIDNTLIPFTKEISTRNKRAIINYVKAGGAIHLITGKVPYAIYDLVNELGLNHLIHAGANGGVILKDNKEIPLYTLSYDSKDILTFLKKEAIPYFIYYKEATTYDHDNVQQQHIDAIEALKEPPVSYNENHDYEALIKILIFKDKDEEFEAKVQANLSHLNNVALVRTASYLYEFLHVGMSKMNAVNYINVNHEYCIAIGDSENDLSMLLGCDEGYIVANASPSLKEYGFKELPSASEDGVAILLESLLV